MKTRQLSTQNNVLGRMKLVEYTRKTCQKKYSTDGEPIARIYSSIEVLMINPIRLLALILF